MLTLNLTCVFTNASFSSSSWNLVYLQENIAIPSKLHAWISNFLSHRRKSVVINGDSTSFYSVNAGVPQGSVLVPTLCHLNINDLICTILHFPILICSVIIKQRVPICKGTELFFSLVNFLVFYWHGHSGPDFAW